jgi:hypothetical protein
MVTVTQNVNSLLADETSGIKHKSLLNFSPMQNRPGPYLSVSKHSCKQEYSFLQCVYIQDPYVLKSVKNGLKWGTCHLGSCFFRGISST